MKYEILLYINGQKVEFNADPKLLLNYKETELSNPTVVRNAWTKQITVEGTNNNNDLFGHIWDLDRYQAYVDFNPIKKAPFQLFVNGELFQKGYCKLDSVTMQNNTTTYSFTLYGGLGQFFYNLTYGSENDNVKKTLADLMYTTDGGQEVSLDFTINKDTIYSAWTQLCGYNQQTDEKFKVINFAPCYNGLPQDFSADKALINNYGMNEFTESVEDGGKTYTTVYGGTPASEGYSLATLPEEMTEWETFDLRSYAQRPVLNMYKFIQACCNPQNNGGYKVELDEHFFNLENPYYGKAYMTLPMLKDLDGLGGGESTNITTASLVKRNNSIYDVDFGQTTISSFNNINMDISVGFDPTLDQSAQYLYPFHEYNSKTSLTFQADTYVKNYTQSDGVVLQLFAYGEGGSVVAQSKAYLLAQDEHFAYTWMKDLTEKFYDPDQFGGDIGVKPEYEFIRGFFKKGSRGNYYFCDINGNEKRINFKFSSNSPIVSLVLKVKLPHTTYYKYAFSGQESYWTENNTGTSRLYTVAKTETTGNKTKNQATSMDSVLGRYFINISSLEAISTDYGNLFTNTKVTKENLLGGLTSPADYLLGYCKLFGLYFYYDSTEEADDTITYPSGVVHIMDRDTFYTEETVDISKEIDYGQKLTITPATAEAKWYSFNQEQIDSEVNNDYVQQYGKQYGSQTINTNYEFDLNTTELYDGNVYKGGVMAREKNKYYKQFLAGIPPYAFNGMTYELFTTGEDGLESYEITNPSKSFASWYNINDYDLDYYDFLPKLVCHTEDKSPSDGAGVLLFFKGAQETRAEERTFDYWVTDDVQDMVYLNEGEPCWIMTKSEYDKMGNRIAYKFNYLPSFTRDLTLWGQEGNIVHSWNFGHPQATFVPNTYTTEGDSIYDKCWKNYINDMYDENARKLNCYVKAEFDGRPWPYWLRRYYWFQNSIWRLNEIKDLDLASFGTTQMTFIKVQDPENYKLDRITAPGDFNIALSSYSISCNGGSISGTVTIQNGGGWFAPDYFYATDNQGVQHSYDSSDIISPLTGRGTTTTFTLNIPRNTGASPLTWRITLEDDFDRPYSVYITQESCFTPALNVSPSTLHLDYPQGSQGNLSITSNISWTITDEDE